jgi:hypothetical protein
MGDCQQCGYGLCTVEGYTEQQKLLVVVVNRRVWTGAWLQKYERQRIMTTTDRLLDGGTKREQCLEDEE